MAIRRGVPERLSDATINRDLLKYNAHPVLISYYGTPNDGVIHRATYKGEQIMPPGLRRPPLSGAVDDGRPQHCLQP